VFTEVDGQPVNLHHADPVDCAAWIEALRGLTAAKFDEAELVDQPTMTVKVLCAVGAGTSGTEYTLAIGSPKDQLVPMMVTGQMGTAWVEASRLQFLSRPFFEILERTAWFTDAYFRLGQIKITDSDGNTASFRGSIDSPDADLTIRALKGLDLKEVPEPTTRAFQALMVGGFRVKRFLGREQLPEYGFAAPTLLLEWTEPVGAGPSEIPITNEGVEKRVIIGSRRADGLYYGVALPESGFGIRSAGGGAR
jgi:hypothetical protein